MTKEELDRIETKALDNVNWFLRQEVAMLTQLDKPHTIIYGERFPHFLHESYCDIIRYFKFKSK